MKLRCNTQQQQLLQLQQQQGMSFGELALTEKKPRAATIVAKEDCHFAILIKKHFKQCLDQIEQRKLQSKLIQFRDIPLLQGWSIFSIRALYYKFTEEGFMRNQLVFQEGDKPDKIYFVKIGEFILEKVLRKQVLNIKNKKNESNGLYDLQAKSVKKQVVELAILNQKQYIGAADAIIGQKRQYNVKCYSEVGCLYSIESTDFLKKLHEYPDCYKFLCKDAAQKEDRYREIIHNQENIKNNYIQSKTQLDQNEIKEYHQYHLPDEDENDIQGHCWPKQFRLTLVEDHDKICNVQVKTKMQIQSHDEQTKSGGIKSLSQIRKENLEKDRQKRQDKKELAYMFETKKQTEQRLLVMTQINQENDMKQQKPKTDQSQNLKQVQKQMIKDLTKNLAHQAIFNKLESESPLDQNQNNKVKSIEMHFEKDKEKVVKNQAKEITSFVKTLNSKNMSLPQIYDCKRPQRKKLMQKEPLFSFADISKGKAKLNFHSQQKQEDANNQIPHIVFEDQKSPGLFDLRQNRASLLSQGDVNVIKEDLNEDLVSSLLPNKLKFNANKFSNWQQKQSQLADSLSDDMHDDKNQNQVDTSNNSKENQQKFFVESPKKNFNLNNMFFNFIGKNFRRKYPTLKQTALFKQSNKQRIINHNCKHLSAQQALLNKTHSGGTNSNMPKLTTIQTSSNNINSSFSSENTNTIKEGYENGARTQHYKGVFENQTMLIQPCSPTLKSKKEFMLNKDVTSPLQKFQQLSQTFFGPMSASHATKHNNYQYNNNKDINNNANTSLSQMSAHKKMQSSANILDLSIVNQDELFQDKNCNKIKQQLRTILSSNGIQHECMPYDQGNIQFAYQEMMASPNNFVKLYNKQYLQLQKCALNIKKAKLKARVNSVNVISSSIMNISLQQDKRGVISTNNDNSSNCKQKPSKNFNLISPLFLQVNPNEISLNERKNRNIESLTKQIQQSKTISSWYQNY